MNVLRGTFRLSLLLTAVAGGYVIWTSLQQVSEFWLERARDVACPALQREVLGQGYELVHKPVRFDRRGKGWLCFDAIPRDIRRNQRCVHAARAVDLRWQGLLESVSELHSDCTNRLPVGERAGTSFPRGQRRRALGLGGLQAQLKSSLALRSTQYDPGHPRPELVFLRAGSRYAERASRVIAVRSPLCCRNFGFQCRGRNSRKPP